MRVRGVRKSFGSNQALRGVDLDLWPGECLGLVGDNAAGKSTFTKILAGTYIPDEGSIELDGEAVRYSGPAEARARGVEMVYQDLSLCDTVDVAGNLYLGRELRRGPFLNKAAMQRGARRNAEAAGDSHPRTSPPRSRSSRAASVSRSRLRAPLPSTRAC